ncbi:hypothetical protein MHU86_9908 [Fragilaria crotonensis]|nr:hypothetical protein MHU86_9908 [Fragilaria crotonensis]
MASPLRIGALIHFNELGFHILHTDIDVLDDPDDRMWDDRLGNETVIDRIWKNDTFDETPAVDMDWVENRTNRHPVIPHAVIGCHCSGASTGVARVIALEYVPVVSMSSTSQLSDDDDFKNFFLTVAPDDARGQVGALVALFRSLGWDRVSVICTDTHYSRDMITKSGEAWVGNHSATPEEGGNAWTRTTIAYSHTISLQGNGDFSDESVLLGLKGMRTKKPLVKSPIIVAMATPDHASRIQGLATQTHFQPDTIWNASGGWVNYAWNAPSLPLRTGNLGLTPFHSPHFLKYQAFLDRYNSYEVMVAHGAEYKLPAHTDLRALFLLSVCGRDNGTAVVDNLCNTNFTGVSGRDPLIRTAGSGQTLSMNLEVYNRLVGKLLHSIGPNAALSIPPWTMRLASQPLYGFSLYFQSWRR